MGDAARVTDSFDVAAARDFQIEDAHIVDVARDADAWNRALADLGGHLLQSWEWGDFKQLHGWDVERVHVGGVDGQGMAQVLFKHRGPFSIGYVPRGPAIAGNVETVWPRLLDHMESVARRRRALSLILEPDRALGLPGTYKNAGFVRGPEHFQPSRTVKVPLLDDQLLLQQMHQKTRYSVRLAQRRGVEVRQMRPDPHSLATFYQLLEDTSQRNEFGVHSRAYYDDFLRVFGDRALLLFALIEGAVAAGLVTARFGNEAIYMYGASSTQHRAHGAAFLLQFEAMRWAREHGCTQYDLWGIPAQDPPSTGDNGPRVARTKGADWRGLYKFKTGFGGEIVGYPPTMERRYRPILCWVARRANVVHG